MPTFKRKMSTSAYILIALIIIAVISLPILHFVGVLDLSFLGLGFENTMMWAATDVLNGVLLLGGVFAGGVIFYYIVKTYLIGTQVSTTTYQQTYNPGGIAPSATQQNEEETVVS